MSDHADRPEPPTATVIDLSHARQKRQPGRSASGAVEPSAPAIEPAAIEPTTESPAPALHHYDRNDVARLLQISSRRVRAWEKAGILKPSLGEDRRPIYSFHDLRAARIVRDLVRKGIAPARVRALLASLDRVLPRDEGALSEEPALAAMRVGVEHGRVVARDPRGAFELPTGQRVLEFETGAATVRALVTKPRSAEGRTAYEWFLEGCRLDTEEATRTRAEAAYRKAVELDRALACAWTNLGALRLAEKDNDEALECFTRAMESDPSQPEAPYNVGYLLLERREFSQAIPLLARAVAIDPGFADAHFNLACALEEAGERTQALAHWDVYLELVPQGPYADIARKRLKRRP